MRSRLHGAPRAAETDRHRSSSQRRPIPSPSGGQTPQIRGPKATVPRRLPASSSSGAPHVPWLVATSPCACLCHWEAIFPCTCVCVSSFRRDSSTGLRSPSALTGLHLQRLYSQAGSHSQEQGLGPGCNFGRTQFTPSDWLCSSSKGISLGWASNQEGRSTINGQTAGMTVGSPLEARGSHPRCDLSPDSSFPVALRVGLEPPASQ